MMIGIEQDKDDLHVHPHIICSDELSFDDFKDELAINVTEYFAFGGLKLICGSHYKPKLKIERPLGEDAHFILPQRQTLGVADGVGGYSKYGVDSGVYARLLMRECVKAATRKPEGFVDPMEVLKEAYSKTMVSGGSTACILTFNDNCLHGVNVGDSGFWLFRDTYILFKSPALIHSFNVPYQLDMHGRKDLPESGHQFVIELFPGDYIIVGTDGLFDNMHEKETEECMNKSINEGLSPEVIAERLVNLAVCNSHNRNYFSPFQMAAQKAGRYHKGGKVDDITVIVGQVVSAL